MKSTRLNRLLMAAALLLLTGGHGLFADPQIDTIDYRDIVSVAGGTFEQANTDGDRFVHTVRDFEIARYQVTYELWYTVREWAEANGYSFGNLGGQGSRYEREGELGEEPTQDRKYEPVTWVNWRDAVVWSNAYSEMTGLEPVYYLPDGSVARNSEFKNPEDPFAEDFAPAEPVDDVEERWQSKNGYRLPSEGEWQYAARWRGTDTRNSSGHSIVEELDSFDQSDDETWYWTPYEWASGADGSHEDAEKTADVAWFHPHAESRSHPVGLRRPNQLGLYDMSGNVWEWTWDWLDDYPADEHVDYRGPSEGSTRVITGGFWNLSANGMQVGRRVFSFGPDNHRGELPLGAGYGFRVARTP